MREFIDAVEHTLLEEDAVEGAGQPLRHFDKGLFDQWENADVCLVGGYRTGPAPTGYMRVGYSIIDVPEFLRSQDEQAANYGLVELYKNREGQLAALINIKLDPSKRKNGMGGRVVRALVATYPDHFVIIDIRRSAVGFWRKMGCEFYELSDGRPVSSPSSHKGTLLGVIRKPGSNTPLNELPAFRKRRSV